MGSERDSQRTTKGPIAYKRVNTGTEVQFFSSGLAAVHLTFQREFVQIGANLETKMKDLYSEMDIKASVSRASCGDPQAWEKLFTFYAGFVWRCAYSKVKDKEDAYDIVQETFFRAFAGIRSISRAECFPAWLRGIALNLARDKVKKRIKMEHLENRLHLLETPENGPTREIPSSLVSKALSFLTPFQQEVIYLYYLEDRSIKEMGDFLQAPLGTVKSRLFDARNKLRNFLKGRHPEMEVRERTLLEEKLRQAIHQGDMRAILDRFSRIAKADFVPGKETVSEWVQKLVPAGKAKIAEGFRELMTLDLPGDPEGAIARMYEKIREMFPEYEVLPLDKGFPENLSPFGATSEKEHLPLKKIGLRKVPFFKDRKGRIVKPREFVTYSFSEMKKKLSSEFVWLNVVYLTKIAETIPSNEPEETIKQISHGLFGPCKAGSVIYPLFGYTDCRSYRMRIKGREREVAYGGFYKDEVLSNGGYDPGSVSGFNLSIFLDPLVEKRFKTGKSVSKGQGPVDSAV